MKIKELLEKGNIKRKYNLKQVKLFGSYSRGEQGVKSDIDFLVEYEKPIDIVGFFSLKSDLENILGKRVDILNQKFLNKSFGKYIEKDLITVL